MCSRGAGLAEARNPYVVRFPDKYGNICACHVAHHQVIAAYFKHSNKAGIHNHAHQHDLVLEEMEKSIPLF